METQTRLLIFALTNKNAPTVLVGAFSLLIFGIVLIQD